IYRRFLDPEPRKAFFETYKEIEALWEILSPSPELRDHITTYKQLAQLYAAVRNAYTSKVNYVIDLANKTRLLIQDGAVQQGLGYLTKTVTFDVNTLEALRGESGSDEAKVFNLVRGLHREVEDNRDSASVLRPLKDRAEQVLKDLEERKTTGLAAMDLLADVASEKEAAAKAAKESGLSPRAFGVYWTLKHDPGLETACIAAMDLAKEAEDLHARFPNAAVNPDEQRRLRMVLYRLLLRLDKEERSRVVKLILSILLDGGVDADE
ncbi:MAG: hypothetical protein OXI86_11095, partial [Candidatus Poribacteria bacterium]|nr:hypothetical protein [Candidatus Poribacteria bacterium]